MTHRIVPPQIAVWLLAIWVSASVRPRAEAEPIKPTAEELKKIASAMPGQASATPSRPRRLLVFTLCKGYYHASIPHGAKAIELMGEKTGAFKAIVSDDIAMFEPESLRQFDGLCLMSALGEFFLPDNLDRGVLESPAPPPLFGRNSVCLGRSGCGSPVTGLRRWAGGISDQRGSR